MNKILLFLCIMLFVSCKQHYTLLSEADVNEITSSLINYEIKEVHTLIKIKHLSNDTLIKSIIDKRIETIKVNAYENKGSFSNNKYIKDSTLFKLDSLIKTIENDK